MTCNRCGKPTSGYHAAHRCQCPPERERKTMSYDERVRSLTDEGVLDAVERMTGIRDVQNRSEDRNGRDDAGLSPAVRRARAANRAADGDD